MGQILGHLEFRSWQVRKEWDWVLRRGDSKHGRRDTHRDFGEGHRLVVLGGGSFTFTVSPKLQICNTRGEEIEKNQIWPDQTWISSLIDHTIFCDAKSDKVEVFLLYCEGKRTVSYFNLRPFEVLLMRPSGIDYRHWNSTNWALMIPQFQSPVSMRHARVLKYQII